MTPHSKMNVFWHWIYAESLHVFVCAQSIYSHI